MVFPKEVPPMTDARRDAMSFPVMATDKGRLIVIDAIDGAGKNMVAGALKRPLIHAGKSIVDLDTVAKESPELLYEEGTSERLADCDVLFVSQPTHVGIGQAIREELMLDHGGKRSYNAWSLAQAFALDREVLYRRTILPFLHAKPGRIVIQVRGLMSSLVYQTLQAEDEHMALTVRQLLDLPGNRVELSRRPDLTLLLTISPETAAMRLRKRTQKVDGDVFADPRFQARVSLRYREKAVLEPFTSLGTKIVFVNAEKTKQEVATECFRALRAVIDV